MTQTTKDTDSVCDDKMSAYMFKLHEIDCEIKKIYKEHFNIDPNTASGCSIFPEDEQIERYSQNIAFWRKLKEEYDDVDELKQMRNPRAHYITKHHDEIRMLSYINFKHRPQVIKQIQKRVDEIMSSIPKTINAECCICFK